MTHQNPAWIVPALTIFTILVFTVAIILPMTRMKRYGYLANIPTRCFGLASWLRRSLRGGLTAYPIKREPSQLAKGTGVSTGPFSSLSMRLTLRGLLRWARLRSIPIGIP
jgi:hypothetical protein